MNEAHLHVAINHFPVIGAIIGMVIIIIGLFKKNDTIKQVALWLFVALAFLSVPVLLSGEGAKEMVERLPGVNEELIERHEELAKITFWLLIITGLFSLVQLYFIRIKSQQRKLMVLIAFLAILVSGSAGLTANTGGKIRHPEFENNGIEPDKELKEMDNEQLLNEPEKGKRRKRKGRDH